jgi:hypothetical protein
MVCRWEASIASALLIVGISISLHNQYSVALYLCMAADLETHVAGGVKTGLPSTTEIPRAATISCRKARNISHYHINVELICGAEVTM